MQDTTLKTREREPQAQIERDSIVREAQNKVIAGLKAGTGRNNSTIVTTGRIEAGLACAVQQGNHETVMDLSHGMGGDAAGPSPGFHARAAIVGCVGIAIKMLAAREGLVFRCVEVSVETDFDNGALFGLGNATAAPTETRVDITIESDAPSDKVQSIVDRALAMDPWYLALRDAQIVLPRVTVKQ